MVSLCRSHPFETVPQARGAGSELSTLFRNASMAAKFLCPEAFFVANRPSPALSSEARSGVPSRDVRAGESAEARGYQLGEKELVLS